LSMVKNSFIFLCGIFWILAGARAEVAEIGLTELGVGTVGIDTGLASDILGKNPDAAEIIEQINRCADMDFDEAEKQVLKRILMTDMGGVAALEKEGKAYLNARINALMQQGMFEEVLLLTDQIPVKNRSAEIKRMRAEALFASGKTAEACAETDAFEEEAFIRAVCAETVGKESESALAFDVYRESAAVGHPFFDAAGDVFYRGLTVDLPEGKPDVWEMPIVARTFGVEIFNRPLDKKQLWTLVNQDTVPAAVKEQAKQMLKENNSEEKESHILADLITLAKVRKRLKPALTAEEVVGIHHVGVH